MKTERTRPNNFEKKHCSFGQSEMLRAASQTKRVYENILSKTKTKIVRDIRSSGRSHNYNTLSQRNNNTSRPPRYDTVLRRFTAVVVGV